MRTIAVVNQKGGCGKTITAINLSAFLAMAGRRTLLVDLDPQGHSTLGLAVTAPTRTMYDVFWSRNGGSEITISDVARPVEENFDLAPADILLSAVPEALAGLAGRENILTWAFGGLDDRYDYVIVDCPPNVGPADLQRPPSLHRGTHPDGPELLLAARDREAVRDLRGAGTADRAPHLSASAGHPLLRPLSVRQGRPRGGALSSRGPSFPDGRPSERQAGGGCQPRSPDHPLCHALGGLRGLSGSGRRDSATGGRDRGHRRLQLGDGAGRDAGRSRLHHRGAQRGARSARG